MSYRYERYRERPRSGLRGWLTCLTIGVWVLVLSCAAVRYIVRPQLTDYLNREVARAIDPNLADNLEPQEALRESLQQVPIDVAVPPGELVVSEAQANEYLGAYRQRLAGIDDLRVRFVPGRVEADITVQGFTGTATIQPTVQDGRIVAADAALGQPLGSFVSIDELLAAFQERLNAELNTQGRRVTAIRVEQGQAIVTVE